MVAHQTKIGISNHEIRKNTKLPKRLTNPFTTEKWLDLHVWNIPPFGFRVY